MISLNTPADALDALALFIKETRLRANVTMQELADQSGVGVATLSRLEKKGICSTETMARVLGALGVLDNFIEFLKPPPGQSIAELRQLSEKPKRQRARSKS